METGRRDYGIVARYFTEKRFGFLSRMNGGAEVFFHLNQGWEFQNGEFRLPSRRLRDPQPGDKVIFIVEDIGTGPRARIWAYKSLRD